jgi:Calcineurin-like phosphoesterase superfamily domain
MIAFIGDVHRAFDRLAGVVAALPAGVQAAIQVGDLGLHQDDLGPAISAIPNFARPIYYVTGNHDYEPCYRGLARPTEMAPNLVYVPRGTVLELDGRRIAFLGGGDSVVDRAVRRAGVDWWPEERVTMEDVALFEGVGSVDFFVTHTPPAFVYPLFHLSPDPSARAVERAWLMLGRPPVICGHLHKPREVGGARVLGELEVIVV